MSTSFSSTTIRVAKLTDSNWQSWTFAVKHVLNQKGLWKSVEGSDPDERKADLALAEIVGHVGEANYPLIYPKKTGKEAWDALKNPPEPSG